MISDLFSKNKAGILEEQFNKIFPGNKLYFYPSPIPRLCLETLEKGLWKFEIEGSGFKSVLAIITAIVWVQSMKADVPLLLLLDEPTAFLHDKTEQVFMNYLKDLPNVQTIVATHSASLIMQTDASHIISCEQIT